MCPMCPMCPAVLGERGSYQARNKLDFKKLPNCQNPTRCFMPYQTNIIPCEQMPQDNPPQSIIPPEPPLSRAIKLKRTNFLWEALVIGGLGAVISSLAVIWFSAQSDSPPKPPTKPIVIIKEVVKEAPEKAQKEEAQPLLPKKPPKIIWKDQPQIAVVHKVSKPKPPDEMWEKVRQLQEKVQASMTWKQFSRRGPPNPSRVDIVKPSQAWLEFKVDIPGEYATVTRYFPFEVKGKGTAYRANLLWAKPLPFEVEPPGPRPGFKYYVDSYGRLQPWRPRVVVQPPPFLRAFYFQSP